MPPLWSARSCARVQSRQSTQPQAQSEQIEATRPTCEGEKDCAAKWDAAQLYVIKNAGYQMQIATNVLIETFNSHNRAVAMSVTKEPLGGGRYRFIARAWCDSFLGCYRLPADAVLGFNRQVAAAAP